MISGPHRLFCEGIVRGLSGVEAYASAYPKAARKTANAQAARLMGREDIQAEIQCLREKADLLAGSAVMDNLEKRKFLARVVRCKVGRLDRDSDLLQSIKITEDGTEFKVPDKLAAIREDNNLAGEGAEAKALEVIVRRAWITSEEGK